MTWHWKEPGYHSHDIYLVSIQNVQYQFCQENIFEVQWKLINIIINTITIYLWFYHYIPQSEIWPLTEAEWCIYASVNQAIKISDNGWLPSRRQDIIWTNDDLLLIRPSRTSFSEILIEIQIFSLKKIHLKMSSAKWQPYCLGLSVLMRPYPLHLPDYVRWWWWRSRAVPVWVAVLGWSSVTRH